MKFGFLTQRIIRAVVEVFNCALKYLLEATGFTRVEIRYTEQAPDAVRMRGVDPASLVGLDPATATALTTLATAYNANASILNALLFAQRYRTLEGEASTAVVLSTSLYALTLPLWVAVLALV